jgi:hypothetical protein
MQSKFIVAALATTGTALKLSEKVDGDFVSAHVDGDHLHEPEYPEGSACVIEEVEGQHYGFGYDPYACLEEKVNTALEDMANDLDDRIIVCVTTVTETKTLLIETV